MTAILQHPPARRPGHSLFRLGCTVGFALTLAILPADMTAASRPPCGASFKLASERRNFDGAQFEVVRLESSLVTLTAYTFGAWMPTGETEGPFGLTCRHKTITSVRLGLSPLDASQNPRSARQWDEYVDTILDQLGETATVEDVRDSTDDSSVVELMGWTTREAHFVVPRPDGSGIDVEYHVVVSGPDAGAVFVLSGPQNDESRAERDFRFFLSRISRPG